jgi:hypothetical protein
LGNQRGIASRLFALESIGKQGILFKGEFIEHFNRNINEAFEENIK